jgi:hypothetical protein
MIALLASFQLASAQSKFGKFAFEVGPEIALPMGDFSDVSGLGFGAVVTVKYPVMPKLVATATAGYLYFLEKEQSILGSTIKTQYSGIPIVAGVRYYVMPALYVGGEVGILMMSGTAESNIPGLGNISVSDDTNKLSFAPQVGYEVGKFCVSAQYVIAGDFKFLGARVGYAIGGK